MAWSKFKTITTLMEIYSYYNMVINNMSVNLTWLQPIHLRVRLLQTPHPPNMAVDDLFLISGCGMSTSDFGMQVTFLPMPASPDLYIGNEKKKNKHTSSIVFNGTRKRSFPFLWHSCWKENSSIFPVRTILLQGLEHFLLFLMFNTSTKSSNVWYYGKIFR